MILLLSGCSHRYHINQKRLKLSYRIDHGFTVYQLDILQLDSNNCPKDYEKNAVAYCVTNCFPSQTKIHKVLPPEALIIYLEIIDLRKSISDSLSKLKPSDRIMVSSDTSLASRKYFQSERMYDSIIETHFSFKPAKTIFFNKKNRSYWWRFESYSSEDIELLPFEFIAEVWYKIEFSNESCYTDDYYFKFDGSGKVKTKHREYHCGAPW